MWQIRAVPRWLEGSLSETLSSLSRSMGFFNGGFGICYGCVGCGWVRWWVWMLWVMWWVWRREASGGSSGGYVGQVVMDLVTGFSIFYIHGGGGFLWWWGWAIDGGDG